LVPLRHPFNAPEIAEIFLDTTAWHDGYLGLSPRKDFYKQIIARGAEKNWFRFAYEYGLSLLVRWKIGACQPTD
jgi:hypothetical protein